MNYVLEIDRVTVSVDPLGHSLTFTQRCVSKTYMLLRLNPASPFYMTTSLMIDKKLYSTCSSFKGQFPQ